MQPTSVNTFGLINLLMPSCLMPTRPELRCMPFWQRDDKQGLLSFETHSRSLQIQVVSQ